MNGNSPENDYLLNICHKFTCNYRHDFSHRGVACAECNVVMEGKTTPTEYHELDC